jgi:multiple sugar transport system substrate-binding protein
VGGLASTRRVRTPSRRLSRSLTAVAAISAVGVIAGCASGGSSASGSGGSGSFAGQTITALVSTAGAGQQSQYNAYHNALAAAFHKETGATVKWQYFSTATQENSLVQTSLVSGSGPDVISFGSGFIGTAYATGGFVKLTSADWNALGGRNAFLASTLTMSGPDASDDIGVPHTSVGYVMAYNKKIFQKAGITAPPTTWTQWVTDAQQIQRADPGVYGAGFDPSDGLDPWKQIWSYTHQLGSSWMSPNGKTAQLDSPQVNSAMQFYFEQYYKWHIVPPGSLSWNDAQMVAAFLAGKVAMIPEATEAVAAAAAGTSAAGDIAFAPMPSMPYGMTSRPSGGTPAVSIVAGEYWAVPQYAASEMPLILDLMKASISTSISAEQYKLIGWTPVTKSAVSALEAQDPSAKPFMSIVGDSEPTEFTGAWADLEAGIASVVQKTATNLATNGGKWSASAVSGLLSAANSAAS